MTLADLRHPMASRWEVRPVARSDAMLPGSYVVLADNGARPELGRRAPDRQHPRTPGKRQERLTLGYPSSRLIGVSRWLLVDLIGWSTLAHSHNLWLSSSSSWVCVVYSHDNGEAGWVPVDSAIKFWSVQPSHVSITKGQGSRSR